jgi:hypothetical protein
MNDSNEFEKLVGALLITLLIISCLLVGSVFKKRDKYL